MSTIMVRIHWYGNKYGNQYNINLQCIYPSLKENGIFVQKNGVWGNTARKGVVWNGLSIPFYPCRVE